MAERIRLIDKLKQVRDRYALTDTDRANQRSLMERLSPSEKAMLILTRKVDQGIVISGNILVRVLGVERDRVKIGISAPGEVTVLRQELWHEGEENQPFDKKDQTGTQPAASA